MMTSNQSQQSLSDALDDVLMGLYRLNVQTQKCRWQSSSDSFKPHYQMLDDMLNKQNQAIGEIGLCIDEVGVSPSLPVGQFFKNAAVTDLLGDKDPDEMLKQLLDAQKYVAKSAESLLNKVDVENEMLSNLATDQYIEAEKSMMNLRALVRQSGISARIEVS